MEPLEHLDSHLTVQRQYHLLISSMADYAIYILDPSGLVVGWNPSAQRLMGYEASEIVGKQFSCFYSDEDRRDLLPSRALQTSVRNGIFESQGWRVRKDGSHFWTHVAIEPICSPSGTLSGFAVVTRDLKEHKTDESVSGLSEEWVQTLLRGIPDYAILMLDVQGRVTIRNERALELFLSKEIIGEHFSRFFTEEDRERGEPQAELDSAVQEGRFESEGWRVREDGTRFWANVVIAPLRDMKGALTGFAKVTRDISERREAQAALERTRSALAQSQKMEAMGRLSAGVAHDFNNILQSIISGLEVVLHEVGKGTTAHEFAVLAINSAKRGASLTRHLLSYTHQRMLRPQTIDIATMFTEIHTLLVRTVSTRIDMRMRADQSISALADPGQLHTALLNLAINASHAMPQGGTLTMDSRAETEAGHDWVVITVTDTGVGMDEATLAQAVEPFFTTKGLEGNGLGLSMVQGFAEQSGGSFGITSRLGQGTTVELRLPSVVPAKRLEQVELSEPQASGRLLLVDDSTDVLTTTGAFLEKAGFSVVQVDGGDKALALFAGGERFDAIISDYAMPGMNGADLIADAQVVQPELKALLVTGYAGISYADTLPKGTLVLRKPFRRTALLEALRCIMNETETESSKVQLDTMT